jgi:hypothetical protein
MRSLRLALAPSQIETILSIANEGMLEAQSLSTHHSKWWGISSVPFQAICVFIAIDTAGSQAALTNAMQILAEITTAYDTHLMREALQTAAHLVRGYQQKKSKEVQSISQSLDAPGVASAIQGTDASSQVIADMQLDLNWLSIDGTSWTEILFNPAIF